MLLLLHTLTLSVATYVLNFGLHMLLLLHVFIPCIAACNTALVSLFLALSSLQHFNRNAFTLYLIMTLWHCGKLNWQFS